MHANAKTERKRVLLSYPIQEVHTDTEIYDGVVLWFLQKNDVESNCFYDNRNQNMPVSIYPNPNPKFWT